ncbi:MAG: tRNA (cytidine/uridine-2'-O-)-methyltransferase TrmJ [marine bacterium B5-7]|nr:MAG: tRNA (cytidine/uridine-2'-O-)-methyltransferase TrmJ [marine bacterium B5-7]
MLNQIKIVLVEPSHPGNIGAAARAVKNMGLSQLVLVNPNRFPHQIATERAAGADDILEAAQVVSSLDEAIADCQLILGTSARDRSLPWPMLDAHQAGQEAVKAAKTHQVAMLFGRERVGLTREELQRCHYHVQIPTNPEYSSLNLSQAVQVMAYEMRLAACDDSLQAWDCEWSTERDMQLFFEHLEKVMHQVEFLRTDVPRQTIARIVRLFKRSKLDKYEMGIMRGFLAAIEKDQTK